MTSYNRRDVLKAGTGATLIACGIVTGGTVSAGDDESDDSQPLPETEQPDGWTSYGGSGRNAYNLEANHQLEGDALEAAWELETTIDSIAVADGTVYTTIDRGASGGVVAFNADDGSVEWEHDDLNAWQLAVTDETVYVSGHFQVCALDRTDGDRQWTVDFDRENTLSEAEYESWQLPPDGATYPTVAYGAVYTSVTGSLYALEPDGSIRWQIEPDEIDEQFVSSPAAANGLLYAPIEQGILALDPTTGEEAWRITDEYSTLWNRSRVAASSTALAFKADNWDPNQISLHNAHTGEEIAKPDGQLSALDDSVAITEHDVGGLTATDLETGDRLWRETDIGSQPVLVGDTVYAYDGDEIVALDKNDGTIQWEFDPGLSSSRISFVVSNGMVFVDDWNDDGMIVFRDASAETDGGSEDDCGCDEDDDGDPEDTGSDSDDGDETGDTHEDEADDGESDGNSEDTGADSEDGSEDADETGDESDDAGNGAGDEPDETDDNESSEDADEAENGSNGSEDDADSEGMPGFGVVTGLAGAAGGAALAARRVVSSDDVTNRD